MSGAMLPPAQQRLFEKLGRDFDNREYNKAIRAADAILGVVPNHADTLAMKGLSLFYVDKKKEAMELINKAVATDPSSTVPWHTLGMCLRSEKKFPEALKAFKRAHQNDGSNTTVLRDLGSLSIHLREWDLFVETRNKMLAQKASVRAHWIALACGHKMNQNTALAAAVMDVMTTIMEAGENPVERNEVHLFRVELELANDAPRKALELLRTHDADIVDHGTKSLLRARAHAMLGQKEKAERQYLDLIAIGFAEADCIAAIAALHKIPLDEYRRPKKDVERYGELLQRIITECPRSDYAKRHALDCVPQEQFRERLESYAAPFVARIIPSLFGVFKSLYSSPQRAQVIGEVFHDWEKQVLAGDTTAFGHAEQSPCHLLWIWCYLASHYRRLSDFTRAHEYIDQAIHHTPTMEILYLMRAKIFLREGKPQEAAAAADVARTLDLQDKYLCTKAAKYMFRANRIAEGENLLQLFYKERSVANETFLTALESQCAWYEREVGDAYYRLGDYVSALQNYLMYEKHHADNHNESLDFHNYVFRRCTMRPWFDFIARDDHLERSGIFHTFCTRIVRTYMRVAELGEGTVRAHHVPRAELEKTGKPEEDKRLAQLWNDFYLQNISLEEPMKNAERYLTVLISENGNDPETHILAVEYYSALSKPLLVARSLLALSKMQHPKTAELTSAFQSQLAAMTTLDDQVRDLANEVVAVSQAAH